MKITLHLKTNIEVILQRNKWKTLTLTFDLTLIKDKY